MIPTAKGRPRFSRRGPFVKTYTPPATEQAEITFLSLAAPHAPSLPIIGPVSLHLDFVLPAPGSWPKWKQALIDKLWPCSGGDIDNYVKLIMDAFNRSGRWWRDDAQVVQLAASKRYGVAPCVFVTLSELEQPDRPQ